MNKQYLTMVVIEWLFKSMELLDENPKPRACGCCWNTFQENIFQLNSMGGQLERLTVKMGIFLDKEPILFRSPNDFDFKAPGHCIGHLPDQEGRQIFRAKTGAHYVLGAPEKYDASKLEVFQEHLLLDGVVIPSWGATYDGEPFTFMYYTDGDRALERLRSALDFEFD